MGGITRRGLIGATAGALGSGSVAGCLGRRSGSGGEDGREGVTARASFFVFGDFTSRVAGEAATAETLVPVGQHGHGWEPGPRVQREVIESDLFVYGWNGFQPWADDIVKNVDADGDDVTAVAAAEGIDLLGSTHEREEGHGHDGREGGSEGESGGDRGDGADPHFWLDPLLAKRAVDTVRDGFVAVDGGNEDAYRRNAAAYRSHLDDLDERFRSALEGRSTDAVLVGGHGAFRYLGERYGFEIEALTGLSPDDRPTPRDIERAQEVVAERDIEYVVADPLESQTAAEQLVRETDAREILPLTSIPGRTRRWADEGWGYLEIMDRINLPTLKRALGAR